MNGKKNTLKARIRPKTYKSYKQLIELYIKPHLRNFKIKDINPLLIQNMYAAMITKGLSPSTVRYTHTVLKNALNQAIKWQILKTNPYYNVDLPKQTRKEMKTLTPEQAKKFLETCIYNRWGVLFEILLTSCMRPEEALGLKLEDIDFKNNRIHIKRVLTNKRRMET